VIYVDHVLTLTNRCYALLSRKAQEVTSFFPNTDEPHDATITPIINAFPVTRTMPVVTLAAAAALASGTFQVVGFVDAAWNIYDKIVDGKVISDEKKMELRLLIESLEEIKEELEDKQEVFEANTAEFSVELQHLQKADASREQAHDKVIATLERALQDAYRDGTASLVRAHTKAITDLKPTPKRSPTLNVRTNKRFAAFQRISNQSQVKADIRDNNFNDPKETPSSPCAYRRLPLRRSVCHQDGKRDFQARITGNFSLTRSPEKVLGKYQALPPPLLW
jgi:hypothetical protein